MKKLALFLAAVTAASMLSGCVSQKDVNDAYLQGYQRGFKEGEEYGADNALEGYSFECGHDVDAIYYAGYKEARLEYEDSGYDGGYESGYREGYQDGYGDALYEYGIEE